MRRFIVYGLLGWSLEIIWTGLGSLLTGDVRLTAWTYLWMFPIYGLGIALEPLHDRIAGLPWAARGLIWMMVFFAIEYATGWSIRVLVGVSPWNYAGAKWNIDGLIRLDYAPVWFIIGLAFERVHDFLRCRRVA